MSIKKLIPKFKRVLQLTLSDWRDLGKASAELLAARIRLSTASPEQILRELKGESEPSPNKPVDLGAAMVVKRVSRAVTLAARYVPWRSDCLIQVMAADRWLRRLNVRGDFHLGVAKDPHGDLRAHAWLRYGDLTVTGGRFDEFSPLIEPSPK